MIERVLFVDLENMQKLDLSRIPADVRVMVFYGVTQKKLPEELVVQAQPLGSRLEWKKIAGQGPKVCCSCGNTSAYGGKGASTGFRVRSG